MQHPHNNPRESSAEDISLASAVLKRLRSELPKTLSSLSGIRLEPYRIGGDRSPLGFSPEGSDVHIFFSIQNFQNQPQRRNSQDDAASTVLRALGQQGISAREYPSMRTVFEMVLPEKKFLEMAQAETTKPLDPAISSTVAETRAAHQHNLQ